MNKKKQLIPDYRKQNYESKKMNTYKNSGKRKDKNLPWWVELLLFK